MITLNILQYLEDEGFGEIDESLFFEKLALGNTGIAIFSRGGEQPYGRRSATQAFDLYSRGTNDVTGMQALEDIRTHLSDSFGQVCTLPTTEYSDEVYDKCRFVTIENIQNLGLDDNDRVIYRLGAQIIYSKT